MRENFNERANALAMEYWRLKHLLSKKDDEERLEEIERLLERGISGKLRERLEAEARVLRRDREERMNAMKNLEIISGELLELTAEFAPNLDFNGNFFPYDSEHDQLSEDFFRAITDIFFGNPLRRIELRDAVFSSEGIKVNSDESPLRVLDRVISLIQETAKKKMGMQNLIDDIWRRLSQNEYAFIVLSVLVSAGRALSKEEIKEISCRRDREYKELVKDYDKKLMAALSFLVSDGWGHDIVRENGGKYEITGFGEWIWKVCNSERGKRNRNSQNNADSMSSSMRRIVRFFRR